MPGNRETGGKHYPTRFGFPFPYMNIKKNTTVYYLWVRVAKFASWSFPYHLRALLAFWVEQFPHWVGLSLSLWNPTHARISLVLGATIPNNSLSCWKPLPSFCRIPGVSRICLALHSHYVLQVLYASPQTCHTSDHPQTLSDEASWSALITTAPNRVVHQNRLSTRMSGCI